MPDDPKFTEQALDDQRKFFRDAAGNPKQSFLPVKERAGQVADMLDELKERRTGSEYRPCRACGERGHTNGGYCPDHS